MSSNPESLFHRAIVRTPRRRRARGTTTIEMLMVFPVMLALWLGLTQLGLVVIGHFVVSHAAHRAARAAIVVLDDDPKKYGQGAGERNVLNDDDPRLSTIRSAAIVPLTVLAPSDRSLDFTKFGDDESPITMTLSEALRSGIGQALMGFVAYNSMSVALTLRKDGEIASAFQMRDLITARVDYLFPCRVPIGAHLICKSYEELVADDETREALARVEWPKLQELLAFAPWRFLLISGEETLPNQGADYHGKYPDKAKKKEEDGGS